MRRVNLKRNLIICFAVLVLVELFICNYMHFWTVGESSSSLLYPAGDMSVTYNGMEADGSTLNIVSEYDVYILAEDINTECRDIYIGLEKFDTPPIRGDEGVDITVYMKDGAHTEWYTRGGTHTVCRNVDRSKYISIRPMGELTALMIRFGDNLGGTSLTFDDISVNRPVPMHFSILRVLVIYLLLLLVYAVRPGSAVFRVKYDPRNKKQTAGAVCLCLALSITVIHFTDYMTQYAENGARDPYNMLAHALSQGKVSIDDDLSDMMGIAEAEHPYVPDARSGYSYNWDSAFYNGHYYVYYGIVPEILFYLPHYLLTEKDLNIRWPLRIELLLIIFGGLFLFREMSGRFDALPYVLWLLLLASSLMGMYLMTLSKVPTFYYLPPAMAIAATLWGLYFWLSSVRSGPQKAGADTYVAWRIAAGSLCMALVIGCRPQMIIGSILAVPIFMEYFIKKDSESYNTNNTVKYILCGGVPYILVFVPILYYNSIRFSGPFDFGAAYNLTAIDLTQINSDFGKLIPGLFTYWFRLPRISMVFPFVMGEAYETSYIGDIFSHWGFGGLVPADPLLLFAFLGLKKRSWIPGSGVRLFIRISFAVSVVITVADLMAGGYMPRYLCDIAPFLFAAALPVVFPLVVSREDTETGRLLVSVLCYICIASIMYHYFLYYTLDDGSQFGTWDRDVFVRAAHFWQWWE